jgi:lysophospholipase
MAAWWFDGADGARLRAALLPASGAPRGSVVLSPGRTEPIEKNFETAQRLADGGFAVLVHDWRGQGLSQRALSDRLLGHAEGYEPFLCDYEALLDTFGGDLPWPWIALGHSMGGALTLLALAKGEGRFAGAVLSAPMMGVLTGQVPRPVARGLASLLTSIGRGGRPVFGPPGAPAPFEANVLTHDPVRYARNLALVAQAPDLALGLPTWGWLAFAFAAARELERGPGVAQVEIPVTVVAAGEEALVDNAAMRRVTERLPHGRLVTIDGARHEILQETDALQAPFWTEFDDLAARVAPRP